MVRKSAIGNLYFKPRNSTVTAAYSGYYLSEPQLGRLRKVAIKHHRLCLLPYQLIYGNELLLPMKPKKAPNGNWQSASLVSLSFIRDLRRHQRQTGSLQPNPHGGGAVAKLGAAQLPIVAALVEAQPDALLEELCERFAQQTGVEVSGSTMQRAVSKLKLSVKKKR